MEILIFTAKEIGARLTKTVLQNFSNDEYEVIVCRNDAESVYYQLVDTVQNLSILDEKIISKIENGSKTYDCPLNLWGGYIFKKKLLLNVPSVLSKYWPRIRANQIDAQYQPKGNFTHFAKSFPKNKLLMLMNRVRFFVYQAYTCI